MRVFFLLSIFHLKIMSALSEMKKMRMLCSAAFKLTVISFSKNANDSAASRQFGIRKKIGFELADEIIHIRK